MSLILAEWCIKNTRFYGFKISAKSHDFFIYNSDDPIIKYPMIISRNAKEETDRRAVLFNNGVMSRDEWRRLENLDSAHQSASGRADSFQKVASVRIALTNFHAVLFTIQRISVYIV